MTMEPPPLPPPSQASSHFPLEPIPASVLAEAERKRRDALDELGRCSTGCAELDDHVLLGGGFERGCVVGLSAEEEDVGVLVGCRASLSFPHLMTSFLLEAGEGGDKTRKLKRGTI
jgi:hypothetical protein